MVAFLNPNLLITIFAAQPDLESEISLIHFAKLRSQTFSKKERPRKPDHDDNRCCEVGDRGGERRHFGLERPKGATAGYI